MTKQTEFQWETGMQIADLILYDLRPYFTSVFLGGSILRQCSVIHDIDLAFLLPYSQVHKASKVLDWHLGKLVRGGSKTRTYTMPLAVSFVEPSIQVDCWITYNWKSWGALCAFVAGCGEYNIIQRAKARREGYTLGFELKKGDEVIETPTERDLYDIMGWEWVPYTMRTIG